MKLFLPLTNTEFIIQTLSKIVSADTPRAMRVSKRFKAKFDCESVIFPPSILNLLGMIKNTLKARCCGYRVSACKKIWVSKDITNLKTYSIASKLNDKEEYREVTILNRFDNLLQKIVASTLRDALGIKILSRHEQIKSIVANLAGIQREYPFYIQTDVIDFGNTFDIEKARSGLIRSLKNKIDSEDLEIIENIIDPYIGVEKWRTGSPVVQLCAEYLLKCLDKKLEKMCARCEMKFIRYGEDILLFFKSEKSSSKLFNRLSKTVKTTLGEKCYLHPLTNCIGDPLPIGLPPYYSPLLVYPTNIKNLDHKGGLFTTAQGIDFCGYHYRVMDNSKVVVCLRAKTAMKIRERIAFYTRHPHRFRELPAEIKNELEVTVKRLNGLFGFLVTDNGFQFNKKYGIGRLFILPNGVENKYIISQAKILNHYMLRRLRHLHFANHPGTISKTHRRIIDCEYREIGLKTLIDAINKLSSPCSGSAKNPDP